MKEPSTPARVGATLLLVLGVILSVILVLLLINSRFDHDPTITEHTPPTTTEGG